MWFGLFFVLLGISILLKVFFRVHFPIFRTLFAIFLIYFGVRLFVGTWGSGRGTAGLSTDHSIVFAEGQIRPSSNTGGFRRYSVVFGRGLIDLTTLPANEQNLPVEINSVFGETTVLVSSDTPVTVRSTAVFGQVRLPDENEVFFGTLNYRKMDPNKKTTVLHVDGHAVFGAIRFVEKKTEPVKRPELVKKTAKDDDEE